MNSQTNSLLKFEFFEPNGRRLETLDSELNGICVRILGFSGKAF